MFEQPAPAPRPEQLGKITSRATTATELDSINAILGQVPVLLGVDPVDTEPDALQALISQHVQAVRTSALTQEQKDEQNVWLAVAWGDSVVRDLGWEWAMLEREPALKTIAVVNTDRSQAVPVINYLTKLCLDPRLSQTSQMLYNMIRDRVLAAGAPGELKILG